MLEVKHVCYGIDGVPILKDISLGVQKGCIVCLLYTSPSPRDPKTSRMPSSA